MSEQQTSRPRPAALFVAAALEGVEAVVLLVAGVVAIAAGPGSAYPLTAYGVGGTLVLAALLLGLVALGTARARSWSRTPGLVWQVVQVLVGLYALQGQGANPVFAVAAVAPAAVVLVLLCTKGVREATARGAGAS